MAEEKFEREKLLETALQQVAGQLKSSLGNIHGALERIVPPDARDADAGLDMNAAVLTRSYYRILRLANNLSDLAGAGGEISSRRINDDIVGFCREILRKAELPAQLLGLELEFRCEKSSHIIAMDADRLERMLLNLLSNAFKFTSRGGKVTLEVEIGLKEVLLRLTDTGCGMTEEELASAFERYLRTQPLPPPCGLGLGLPLSRGIARELVGRMLEQMQAKGVAGVLLEVRESNLPAQNCYAQAGFTVVGHRKRYYEKPEEDALLMGRVLE